MEEVAVAEAVVLPVVGEQRQRDALSNGPVLALTR